MNAQENGERPVDEVNVDLAIVGSGAAAFAAAIRATELGKSVAMIERGELGGTCVNVGCVPSKALLAAAKARHAADDSRRFPGITVTASPVDMAALHRATHDLVEGLRSEKYAHVAAEYGWRMISGDAAFSGTAHEPHLAVTTSLGAPARVNAQHFLLATGAGPVMPAIPGIRKVDPLTSTTAMDLEAVPDSLLIIGGGYVALEQAQLFARLGSRVTMLVRSRLAAAEEPEAGAALAERLTEEGITVVLGAEITKVEHDTRGRVVAVVESDGRSHRYEGARLLVAAGRRPVTDGLNLDTVGVETGVRGEILVNEQLRSRNPRIWAAGDVASRHEFVYVAAAQGAMVAENAFIDARRAIDYTALPRVIFTSPALAAVGMTEQHARDAGIITESRVLPLAHVPRAIVNRDTHGFIKVVASRDTRQILGITAVAEDAGEIAAAGVHIINARLRVDDVATTWAPYLTMAEGIKLACQTFTKDVAQLSCCAS